MRLICPSCGAQYEVDETVIPEAGRDVQCSNCGNAWFQMSAAQLRAQEAAAADAAETPSEEVEEWTEAEVEPATEAGAELAAEAEAAPEVVAETVPPPVPEPDLQPEPEPAVRDEPEPKRKNLDDAVMNVLREEAARERRAREAEGGTASVAPEVAAVAVAAVAAREAVAPDEAEVSREEFGDDDTIVSRASRRELLPDIEEINSTLRATSDRGGEAASMDAPETLRRRRSGFRMGFSTAIVIAALLLLLYVMAPAIAARIPSLEPALAGYVAAVDGLRGWLDTTLRGLTASMTDGQSGS